LLEQDEGVKQEVFLCNNKKAIFIDRMCGVRMLHDSLYPLSIVQNEVLAQHSLMDPQEFDLDLLVERGIDAQDLVVIELENP
jgi:hypothetical protein